MGIDLDKIDKDIRAGLPQERGTKGKPGRLEEARKNDLYYQGDFFEDTVAWKYPDKSLVTVRLLRRVVEILTANLYRSGPERTFPGLDNATAAFQNLYKAAGVDALMMEADRLALVNQVAAVEVQPNQGDDMQRRPFDFLLWGGADLVVWLDDKDARKPGAVATLDMVNGRRRLRLWTPEELITYETQPIGEGVTFATNAYRETNRQANVYGFLPFAFVHSEFPARYFWTPGLGTALRELNYHVNFRLTVQADDIIHNRPKGVIEGALADYQFPKDQRAGEFAVIPMATDAGGTTLADPKASWIAPDMSYLQADTEQLVELVNRALELLNIPPAAVRMEQTGTASGVALVSEQIPVVQWAEGRQRPFSFYEQALARVVCRIAAAALQGEGAAMLAPILGATAEEWTAAADATLQLKWPEMSPKLPGPQADQADTWLLENQLTSRKRLAMERFKMTPEEADAYLREVAAELLVEAQLSAPIFAAQMPAIPGDPNAPPSDPNAPPEEAPADATGSPDEA